MKSLTLALCVIAILGAAASTFFYVQIGNTKDELQTQVTAAKTRTTEVEAKLAETSARGEALQKQLLNLDNERAEAVSKATTAAAANTQLDRDVDQLRNQLTAKNDAEQALNREISQLKRELAQAKLASAAASPEEIEGYKSTIATLQARVTELESTRSSTVAMGNTTAATAGGSTSAASESTPAPAGLKGEVVSIGAQNAFVVLNIGSAQGVKAGQNYTISRNGATIATAQISSVQANYAVAQIAANSIRGGLAKGDTATVSQ
jgi:hypothetical protein